MLLLHLLGCVGACGEVDLVIGGMGAELYDTDGDGRTDLTERCGTDGAFAKRYTSGATELVLTAYGPNGANDFAIDTWILPVANVSWVTDVMVEGMVLPIEQLAGSGLHEVDGNGLLGSYSVFPLARGSVTFHERRDARGAGVSVLESDEPEDWRMSWELAYGSNEDQRWSGEDWVRVTNGVGTPIDEPPPAPL